MMILDSGLLFSGHPVPDPENFKGGGGGRECISPDVIYRKRT